MDKIITINLGGYAIKMEEDAYEALKPYIRQIEETFANTENGKEIINDIEARLAEMLMERTEGKVSATIEDVEFVKKAMGNPGEFEETQSDENPKQTSVPNDTIKKRLYRDTDNKVFGGVCSGLSSYFDIDPVVIRLIWVVLLFFFGTGFLLYFIMWVIVPEAVTTAQKLEMKGEAPTLDNIINRVKTEAGKVEENLRSQNFGQRISEILRTISPIILTIVKIFALLIGLFVLVVLSSILIALIAGPGVFMISDHGIYMHDFPNFFENDWEFTTVKTLIGLFIGIPLFNILASLLKFVFNNKSDYRPIRRVLIWIWVATIPLLIYFVFSGVKNFKYREKVTTEKTFKATFPLTIKSDFGPEEDFYDKKPVFIAQSEDSLVHISIVQRASGNTKNKAKETALKNGADFNISGNELILKASDYFAKTNFHRNQSVSFTIKIPKGKYFTIDKSLAKNGASVRGDNINYYSSDDRKTPNDLLFLNGNLYCPSCPDSLPLGGSEFQNFKDFNTIVAEGMLDLEVIPGKNFSIQKVGSHDILQHLNIWRTDEGLRIRVDEDYINLKNKPKVIIMMPELHELDLSGAVECKTGHFGGEHLNISLTGACDAIIEAEYGDINANLSGVSSLDISGRAKSVNYEISGASKINSKDLEIENADIHLSGASKIILGNSKSISGEVTGACKVEYLGNPTLHLSNDGVSKIKQIEK